MVTAQRDVTPILDIQDPEFAHRYQLGAWWTQYGDEQGTGPKPDTYFLSNVANLIDEIRACGVQSTQFPRLGFFLGMVHGGVLNPATNTIWPDATTLVTLSNPQMFRGYCAGRYWFFYEAENENERRVIDIDLMERLQELANERPYYQDVQGTIAFSLGCMLGDLSGQLFPLTQAEHKRFQEEDRLFLAEYEARQLRVIVL